MSESHKSIAAFYKLVDNVAMTAAQREQLRAAFQVSLQHHGWDEYQRGKKAGITEAGSKEELTREQIRNELLDTVCSALGIEED